MITLNNILGLRGLSTDIKPTDGILTNCRFWELDTGKYYYFDGAAWQDAPGGGGGGTSGGVINVEGTTPVIEAADNYRYVCGEVSTLSFTPPETGITDIIFTSGSTPTVLTVPDTIRWANSFDPTALEADTTYELNIMDGIGVAISVEDV